MTAHPPALTDIALLAHADLPPAAHDLHARARGLLQQVLRGLECASERRLIPAGIDLFAYRADAYVVVRSGVLKLSLDGRALRTYSPGDLIRPRMHPGARADTLFACEVSLLSRAYFESLLQSCPVRSRAWFEYCELESQLLQLLCAAYAPVDAQPSIALRTYEAGDVVARQGDAPGEIFELLEGEAAVHIDRVEIGRIREGEIFGEMSFLTGQRRVATVTARTPCLIQVMGQEDFARIVRCRPELMISLGRTLAERVSELDRRLVSAH